MKIYGAAALFIALRLCKLYFRPKPTLSTSHIPFALPLVTIDERERSSVAIVEINIASSEETGVLCFLALYCLVNIGRIV